MLDMSFGAFVLLCCLATVINGHSGGHPSNRFQFSGGSTSCKKRCESSTGCPSNTEINTRMITISEACRKCVFKGCHKYSARNENAMMLCMSANAPQCPQCQHLAQNLTRVRKCNSCLRQCLMSRSRNFGGSSSSSRNIPGRSDNCRGRCVLFGVCPSANAILSAFKNSTSITADCRQCAMDTCGPYNESNRDEVAICMFNARGNCSGCNISSRAEATRRNCASCIARCGRGNRLPQRPRPSQRPKPSNIPVQVTGSGECRQRCVFPRGSCPSTNQIISTFRNRTTSECRECAMAACEPRDENNLDEVAMCMFNARGNCSACNVRTGARAQRRVCAFCIARCGRGNPPTQKPKPTHEPKPTQGPQSTKRPKSTQKPKPTTKPKPSNISPHATGSGNCRQRCVLPHGACPSTDRIIFTFRNRTPSECQECAMATCGPRNENNRDEVAMCMFIARGNCSGCSITVGARAQRRSCAACIARCGRGTSFTRVTKRPPIKPRPRPSMRPRPIHVSGMVTCRRSCSSSAGCPSSLAIIATIRGVVTSECRECIMEMCGSSNETSSEERAECMFNKRANCDDCDLSDGEMRQRSSCMTCIETCMLARGGSGDTTASGMSTHASSSSTMSPMTSGNTSLPVFG